MFDMLAETHGHSNLDIIHIFVKNWSKTLLFSVKDLKLFLAGCHRDDLYSNSNCDIRYSTVLNDRIRMDRCEILLVLLLYFHVLRVLHPIRNDAHRPDSRTPDCCHSGIILC